MVNNVLNWRVAKPSCAINTNGSIEVEALANFPIERDLVVDMTHFIENTGSDQTVRIIGNSRTPDQGPNVRPRRKWRSTSSPVASTVVCATPRAVRSES